MAEKRYAIVRVDNICPLITEDNFYCFEDLQKDKCKKCKEIRGDTKEQMVLKVAQVFFRRKLKVYKKILGGEISSKKELKRIYENCLEVAKEIVEFLGVME